MPVYYFSVTFAAGKYPLQGALNFLLVTWTGVSPGPSHKQARFTQPGEDAGQWEITLSQSLKNSLGLERSPRESARLNGMRRK